MARTILNLPSWHPGQQTVWNQRKRFNYLCAGRGWRKTSFLVSIAVEHLLTTGWNAGYYAPTFKHLLNAMQEFYKACPPELFEFNKSENWMKFKPNGATLFFYSLEIPDNSRGTTFPLMLVDEAPLVAEGVWDNILRPISLKAQATYGMGDAWLVGTPNGKNWYWRNWMLAKRRDNMASWQAPALGVRIDQETLVREPHPLENPAYQFDDIEDAFLTMNRRRFRVEMLAEFLEDEGSQFSGVLDVSTLPCLDVPPSSGTVYQTGIDLGVTTDYTVISVLDTLSMSQVYFRRFTGLGWERIYQEIAQCGQMYPGRIYGDKTGLGSHVPEEMGRRGVRLEGVPFTNAGKLDMLDHLSVLIEHKKIRLWHQDDQIFELQACQREATETGLIRIAAPKGLHDDTVMALGLATMNVRPPLLSEGSAFDWPEYSPNISAFASKTFTSW